MTRSGGSGLGRVGPWRTDQARALWMCRSVLLLVLVFVAFPQIDLTTSGLFFDPGTGRFVSEGPVLNLLRKGVPPILYAIVVFLVLQWLGGRLTGAGSPQWMNGRRVAFVLVSLALGPGLIVNAVLKEWWGRARPSDILTFGGHAHFTPPLMMADQCVSNCSFVSGHAAFGFWTVALALLVPKPWRAGAVVAAMAFGALVSGSRIMVGGHFLSDVVFAGLIVVPLTVWLHRVMVGDSEDRAARPE